RQTEACPARLGGEERREEVALRLLGNPRAVIRDCDREELVAMRSPADVVARLDAGHDRELSLAAERLDGGLHQVEKHLLELSAVAEHGRQAGIELDAQGRRP